MPPSSQIFSASPCWSLRPFKSSQTPRGGHSHHPRGGHSRGDGGGNVRKKLGDENLKKAIEAAKVGSGRLFYEGARENRPALNHDSSELGR